MLELEQGLGLGAGPVTQVNRKGLTGKIPFRELSRQCRGEGMVAVSKQRRKRVHCPVPDSIVLRVRYSEFIFFCSATVHLGSGRGA